MAPRKADSKNPADWVKVDFVNVEMSADDKKSFKALGEAEVQSLVDATVRMIENSYKASITYDQSNACFIFSLTGKDERSPNFNLCMTSRSDNVWEAMALAAYKTKYCCPDGDWGSYKRDFTFG